MVQPQQKTVWRFLVKFKVQLPYGPAVPPPLCIRKNRGQGPEEMAVARAHRALPTLMRVGAAQMATD